MTPPIASALRQRADIVTDIIIIAIIIIKQEKGERKSGYGRNRNCRHTPVILCIHTCFAIHSLTTSQCPDGTFLKGIHKALENVDGGAMLPIECCQAYIQRTADPEWKAIFFCSSGVDHCSDSNSPIVGWEARSLVNENAVAVEPSICAQACIISFPHHSDGIVSEQQRSAGTIYDSVLALIAFSAVALALLVIAVFSIYRYRQGKLLVGSGAEVTDSLPSRPTNACLTLSYCWLMD